MRNAKLLRVRRCKRAGPNESRWNTEVCRNKNTVGLLHTQSTSELAYSMLRRASLGKAVAPWGPPPVLVRVCGRVCLAVRAHVCHETVFTVGACATVVEASVCARCRCTALCRRVHVCFVRGCGHIVHSGMRLTLIRFVMLYAAAVGMSLATDLGIATSRRVAMR